MKMRAISLKQPWANLIAEGKKTVETRKWETNFRGDLLIVSSKMPAVEPAGCAIAIVTLIDCRPTTKADESAACAPFRSGFYAWELGSIRKLKRTFPVTGLLRVYEIEVDEDQLEIAN